MLFQFSLYGFLKNQRYFEPFLILAFLDKGLSFTLIGLLIGFREICINLMEVPTGAVADVIGRRRSMIFSFSSYMVSFFIFGISNTLWTLFAAMLFFSMGDAFRTGTHKAMIFDWLSRQGRESEKTQVYGFTRSWSKMGSAVSVVVATLLVFFLKDYQLIFFLSMIPYALNIVNFLKYPKYLDGPMKRGTSPKEVLAHLAEALKSGFQNRQIRRLFMESMSYEGTFKVIKEYLQPVLQSLVLALPLFAALQDVQRTALLVGLIYFMLHFLSSIASRKACWFETLSGSGVLAARNLWLAYLVVFGGMTAGLLPGQGLLIIAVIGFILLALLQNIWRPILISRFADAIPKDQMATMLSVESQGKTLFAAFLAPLLGLMVDYLPEAGQFVPVGVLGLVMSLLVLGMLYIFPKGNRFV